MRTNSAPSMPGHLPVDDDDVGRRGTDQLEAGRTVGGFINSAHADAHKQGAHDLAHVMLVVHHQDLGGGEPRRKMFNVQASVRYPQTSDIRRK